MGSVGSARAASASSPDHSSSSPRRKRARRADASPARSGGLWRESRGANGQVVLSLESDDDDDEDDDGGGGGGSSSSRAAVAAAVAADDASSEGDFEMQLQPPRKPPPVIYSVDSDSDEEEDVVHVVGAPAAETSDGHGDIESESAEDGEEEEEEEEWRLEGETETHESEESDVEEEEEEDDKAPDDMTPAEPLVDNEPRAVLVKEEIVTPLKAEPPHPLPLATATVMPCLTPLKPLFSPDVQPQFPVVDASLLPPARSPLPATPVHERIKSESCPDGSDEPLISFSQLDHETPPARVRPQRRHPRAARRAVVRRCRMDEEEAGKLLFGGPQYVPPASVVKNLIEFIARSVGPMSGPDRRWVDYVLLAKLNNSVDSLSDEVITRYSDWMRIALGVENESSHKKHRVQREPLLTLPIRYTVRPTPVVIPRAPSNGKAKAKASASNKKDAVDTKWLERQAAELQGGGKRIKSETPRRRVSVSTPAISGPFSPTSSTASSVSSRSRRPLHIDVSAPAIKRQRRIEAPSYVFGMYSPSPSTASTTTAPSPWPSAAFLDLAKDDNTTGTNRSMPKEWESDDAHFSPSTVRPAAINPLYTMSLSELKAHINSVRHDGRVRSFEKPLEILQKMMGHPRNRFGTFNVPVDPVALKLPTYNDIVKAPMDLGTIRIRLEEAVYLEQDDFIADVRLVFENAMKFNPPNHSVHVDASFLMKHFEELLRGDSRDRHLKRRGSQSTDRHACRVCLGNTCAMCDQGCLPFAHPHLQCSGSCGAEIRKGSIYYTTRDGTRVWCAKCRLRHVKTPSDLVENGDKTSETQSEGLAQGANTKKKKAKRGSAGTKQINAGIETIEIPCELERNKVELDVEPWVKCARCLRWLHQVCGLYNPVYGAYTAEHEYNCPLCVWKQRSPPPALTASTNSSLADLLCDASPAMPAQNLQSSCRQIPTCELSVFIEDFLRKGLRELKEFEAADGLHVRVLSFPQERVHVSERVVSTFDENASLLEQTNPDRSNYHPQQHRFPSEIAYTSRGIYLFQRLQGAEVCLFTLFVQEFGDECALESNRKSVYVAYLDSIRYLAPPSARTASYHLIMMAYFDFIRRHGFKRVHIWSCPPMKRISYVFWQRPGFQKTPSAEHLRAWYKRLLTKAQEAGIVRSWTTMYDEYFAPHLVATAAAASGLASDATGGNSANATVATRGSATRSVDPKDHAWPVAVLPPLFDGDFIPAELDRILGHLAARNGKNRRDSGGGKSSSVGSTGGKLAVGEFVARMKEEDSAAPTLAVPEFKVREVFGRLQSAVQRLKNDLLVVDLVAMAPPSPSRALSEATIPAWWRQVPHMFGSRFMFHQLCALATYQFDSPRRAKHSTMMLLHHFFTERVRQLNVFCSECFLLIAHADFWHCRQCDRFALCDLCHRRDGRSHAHALVFGGGLAPQPPTAEGAPQH